MVDDFVINVTYDRLLADAQTLYRIALAEGWPLRAIQLARYHHDTNVNGSIVKECPSFQRGFGSHEDASIIFSSEGAQWLLDYADRKAEHSYRDSLLVVHSILHAGITEGIFGMSPKHEESAFAAITDVPGLQNSLLDKRYTDQDLSSAAIMGYHDMELTVVVANLHRRYDRWYTCLGALIAREYHHVKRFSAYDWQLYKTFERAREVASKEFPNSRYICNNVLGAGYFCWSWTWYDIMNRIANGEYGELVLLLSDDYAPCYDARKLQRYLAILNHENKIKCVQLSWNDQSAPHFQKNDVLPPGEPVENTPFRYGIHASGDVGNILSPDGAREVLQIADSRDNVGVPNWIFNMIPRELDDTGGYYCSNKALRFLGNKYVTKFNDGRIS